jgi:hypothetical protein
MIRLFEYVSMGIALIGTVLDNTIIAVVSLVITLLIFIVEDIKSSLPTEEDTENAPPRDFTENLLLYPGGVDKPDNRCRKRNNLISCLLCPFKKKKPLPSGCKYNFTN